MKNLEKISLLPQYEQSELMYEQFLDGVLNQSNEVFRSKKKAGIKIAVADSKELISDNLEYFTNTENKKKLEEEFTFKLENSIGKEKAELFCTIIKDFWFDGRKKRLQSPEILKLKRSIQNYLLEYRKVTNVENIRVINGISPDLEYSFEDDEIQCILALNKEMLDWHIQKWLELNPDYLEMSTDKIYLRRGICLENEPAKEYKEWLYINSYSLAFTVSEKFAEKRDKKKSIILNANYSDLNDRILFFSPFIKNLHPTQLEVGIIPHYFDLEIKYKGNFGEIEEYEIQRKE